MLKRSRSIGSVPDAEGAGTPGTTSAQPAADATQLKAPDWETVIVDLEDMLHGRGRHAEHTQTQAGRCAICSCGLRAQGRLIKPSAKD